MFKIYKKQGKDLYDFTNLCGTITLRSTAKEISEELKFNVKGTSIKESDIILLYKDSKKVFEGIVITISKKEHTSSVSCFDFGWYLNKNEDAYQFNDSASNCILRILKDHGIPVGKVENIPTLYKKINRGNLNELISKILEHATKNTGIKYVWQMRANAFYLEKQLNTVVTYKTSLFGESTDITKLMSGAIYEKSIEDLINAVKVVDQEESKINVLAYKEDAESIKKYGKLQKLEYLTKEEKNSAKNVADSQLKLLNKISSTISAELPGVIECRANKILEFDGSIMGIKGKFFINGCTHTINNASHLMTLELEEV